MEAAKTEKLNFFEIVRLFSSMNRDKIRFMEDKNDSTKGYFVSTEEPVRLHYPQGWFYSKGAITNMYGVPKEYWVEIPIKYDGEKKKK